MRASDRVKAKLTTSSDVAPLKPLRVNVVAPGIVRTPLGDRLPEDQRDAYFAARGPTLPVGRIGEPADVAEAYLSFMRSGYTLGKLL